MPPSLKDRGGRLSAFARQNSESNLGQINGKQDEVEFPLEQPRPVAPAPMRQALDNSKAPPRRHTGTPRQGNGFQPPRSPRAPVATSPTRRPRASSQDPHGDIFSGSQLGDNFMNSGLTTPHNEPAQPEPTPEPINLNTDLARDLMNHIPLRRPNREENYIPQPQQPAFAIRNDGRMAVVDKPPRHDLYIGDGFRDNALDVYKRTNGHYKGRPGSPLKEKPVRDPKAPVREVRIRRLPVENPETFDTVEVQRSSTPPAKTRRQPVERPVSVHEDEDSQDEHVTPKAKKPVLERVTGVSVPIFPLESSNKRRRPSPEYDDKVLSAMTFTELKEQPFDFDPTKEEERPISTNADNMTTRLNQFRHRDENEQHALFSNMSLEDWESSGSGLSTSLPTLCKP